MTTGIESLHRHLSRPRSPAERAVDGVLLALFLAAVAYLVLKTWQISAHAAFDFKYFWLAGEAWLRGINPYGPEYHELGKRLITHDYVPYMWVYPPNWFLPSVAATVVGVDAAGVLFNAVNVVLVVAASALLTAGASPLRLGWTPRHPALDAVRQRLEAPWNVFFLHLFAISVLQATALTLSVGQNSIVAYFGISLLIYGLAREREWTGALGLAIALLKPQLALVVFFALLFRRAHRRIAAKAVAISVAASLPAFVVSPSTAFDLLTNITRYDAVTSANWPQSTTGPRNLIWDIFHFDPGNMPLMAAAILLMAALYLAFGRAKAASSGVALTVLASAVTVAIAPLHVYDLVLVGVLLLPLAQGPGLVMATGALGAALLWRAGDLAVPTGFYSAGTEHFEGTRLATLGALLLLAATFEGLRRRPAGRETP